ncbi:MAG: hypothetical protein ABIO43_05315 [Sphingomicrobium sp.]
MNGTHPRLSWSARLLIAISLIIAGAAAAVWVLGRYDPAARFLGITPAPPLQIVRARPLAFQPTVSPVLSVSTADTGRIAQLEERLARVEQSSQRAEGSAGRADALVVAFAARRAIDRGVALGFLENLLIDRFGVQHRQAVATIITASRNPVRLDQLRADYAALGPELRGRGENDGFLSSFRREFGSLIEIRRANVPSMQPDARHARAMDRLAAGDVDAAVAETMRLPGAQRATGWVTKARRYVAAHRALDEIESSALLVGASPR